MSVPASGNFSMFGNSDNTTIQGAITQGGGSVASADDFNELIAASTTSFSSPNNLLFHPASNGGTDVTNINQINNALQYRLYPAYFFELCYHRTDSSNDGVCGCNSSNSSDSLSGDYYIAITQGGGTGVFFGAINITKPNGSVAPTGFYKFGPSNSPSQTQVRFWNSTTGVFNSLVNSGFGVSSVDVVSGSTLSGINQNTTILPTAWSCQNGSIVLVSL